MAGTSTEGSAPGSAAPPPPQPNGHDSAAKTYTVTDSRSAGDAIAGLLFSDDVAEAPPPATRDDERSAPRDDQGADTGAEETSPTGDDQDTGSGEPQHAAIEPPTSWPSDAKRAFAQLPPELQQTVVQRESEREAMLTRRSQEAAESRRAFEAEQQAAAAQRSDYLRSLEQVMALAMPEAQALQNVDWVATQRDNPTEFTRLQALQIGLQQRLGSIGQAYSQAMQQQQQAQAQALYQRVEQERNLLNTAWPDYADQARGNQLRGDLTKYLGGAGFSNEEMNQAYDHRLVVLATKAMLYDRQLAARATANGKRDNPPPQVQRPGTSQGTDRGEGARLGTAVRNFGRTNSARDAGSLIAELLS